MNRRLRKLFDRERIVVDCLRSSIVALCFGLQSAQNDREHLTTIVGEDGSILWHGRPPTPAEWYARAETPLLFAQAELSYLTGPAPK